MVDDILVDTKRYQIIVPAEDPENPTVIILTHTRTLGDRSYETTRIITNDMDETRSSSNLTQEEVDKFTADWNVLWMPKVTEDEIYKNNLPERRLL